MEPFQSVNMQTHPCFTFMQRMTHCIKQEEMYSRMCFEEIEDWYECKSRRKHRAFYNWLKTESNKMEMYSLPEYDVTTNSFKDGVLPKNVDSYFDKSLDKRKHYTNWENSLLITRHLNVWDHTSYLTLFKLWYIHFLQENNSRSKLYISRRIIYRSGQTSILLNY